MATETRTINIRVTDKLVEEMGARLYRFWVPITFPFRRIGTERQEPYIKASADLLNFLVEKTEEDPPA